MTAPRLELIGKGPLWYLDASDGKRWTVYHCVDVDGRTRKVEFLRAEFRVFEAVDGALRRYDLSRGERREMKATLLDRQLALANPIKRKRPMNSRRPDPAKPRTVEERSWIAKGDGWDHYREHKAGWGPPASERE